MICAPTATTPGPLWGAGLLTEPAVDLPEGLYPDEVAEALASIQGGALDEEDFFAEHDLDLLALPYYVPLPGGSRWYGRLAQKAGHVCDRANLTPLCEWVLIDLDPPGSEPWADLPDPGSLSWPGWVWCAYTTPKGLRVVARCAAFPATHYHNVHDHLASQVDGAVLGDRTLRADASGGQWNRLQRLPHSTRSDGKYPETDGRPLPSRVWRQTC